MKKVFLRTHLKERSIMVITSPCFKRSDCFKTSPLTFVGFAELKLVKITWEKEEEKKTHINNQSISKQKCSCTFTKVHIPHSSKCKLSPLNMNAPDVRVKAIVLYYLFILIQVNPAVLLGDLRELDTNITVRLPVRSAYLHVSGS